jgi:excisionase family DNA binding protein
MQREDPSQNLPAPPNDNMGVSDSQVFDNSFITITQLSEQLRVPVKTIRHWIYRREIPHYKIGRHLRFKAQEIQRWINERRVKDAY